MYSKFKKAPLLILGVTSIACSKVLFWLFNDPEGPNLVVVIGMALIVYFLSLTVYLFNPPITATKRLLLAISIQVIIVSAFYFFLS